MLINDLLTGFLWLFLPFIALWALAHRKAILKAFRGHRIDWAAADVQAEIRREERQAVK